jgi:hypothetical protein
VLYLLHFVKFLGVSLFVGGSVAALTVKNDDDAVRLAFRVMGPGFLLTYVTGFLLVRLTDRSLLEGWLLSSIATGIVALQVVLWAASKPGRRTPMVKVIVHALQAVTMALMVWKPSG